MKSTAENPAAIAVDEGELTAAQQAAAVADHGAYTHQLSRPVTYNGREYSALTFAWDKLTGRDGLAIEEEMQQAGKTLIIPVFSGDYLIRMAARACTEQIGADVFKTMPLSDYNKIRSAARSFLLKSE